MPSMPVLDAKALEIDPKGTAFLLSVLRQSSAAAKSQPKEVSPPIRMPQKVRMHFRMTRRIKQVLPTLV